MGLTKEQILENKKKFEEVNAKEKVFTSSLVDYLGDALFTAPASTMESLHNAFPGGLMDHLLRITRNMILLNRTLPKEMQVQDSTIYKVGFLSEIGKTFLYKHCESEWHRKNQGKLYEFVEDITSMSVGERSVYYAMTHGVELSQDEYVAILNQDKSDDDKTSKYHNSLVGDLLKMAKTLSIKAEQHAS